MSGEEEQMAAHGCDVNAAPYVLGALSEQEHDAFACHLDSCAICREEVAALQVVVDALPAAAPQLSASPELKHRVMASVHEHAAAQSSAAASRSRRPALLRSLSVRPALALAGAVAVIVAVLAVALIPGGGGSSGARVIQAQVLAPRASASLRLNGGHAELSIAGMPQTAPSRVYEVWVKRSGAPQPTDALFTVTARGDATVGVPGSVAGVKQVLVTSEPLGGSRVPTRSPVIVANL